MKNSISVKWIAAFSLFFALQNPLTHAAVSERPIDLEILRKFLLLNFIHSNQFDIATKGEFQSVQLRGDQRPWSGSFLPAITGYAGANYRADDLLRVATKNARYNNWIWETFRKPWLNRKSERFSERDLEHMAPAEKYDLVVGLSGRDEESFTDMMFKQAVETQLENGMAYWTGFCHGWAPASIAVPRPKHKIFVPSFDGKYQVPFFPDDLKSLATVLFANSMLGTENAIRKSTNSEGKEVDVLDPDLWASSRSLPIMFKRCDKKRPQRDWSGRVIEEECADSDPAFFHLMAINMMGGVHRAFIIEKNNNSKVDNQPTAGYALTYFNPATGKEGTFQESLEKKEDFPYDVRADYRLPETKYIVGVKQVLTIVKYRFNKLDTTSAEIDDKSEEVELLYDLELAEDGTVLGGEWRNTQKNVIHPVFGIRPRAKYPDFVWHVPVGTLAVSNAAIENTDAVFDPTQPLPAAWQNDALAAIQFKKEFQNIEGMPGYRPEAPSPVDVDYAPMPLAKVVYRLIEWSRR